MANKRVCTLCGGSLYPQVTAFNIVIWICESCGMVQSQEVQEVVDKVTRGTEYTVSYTGTDRAVQERDAEMTDGK